MASPPQFKPYAISDPCSCSKNSLHVCCLYCLGAALALPVRRPHTTCALHARCLCAACTLPMRCHTLPCALPVRCLARCRCAAMHASVRCHARLCALPCAPLFSTVGNMHVFEPVSRVPTASFCPAVPPRPRRGAPMAWPWPPFFPQDMLSP